MLREIINKTVENYVIGKSLAIIGSREFFNYSYAKKHILDIIMNNGIEVSKIISGGANGTDRIAEKFANDYNIPIEIINADWKLGKSAGVIRNTVIVKKSDYIIAFWDEKSKGTLDVINKAKRLHKKIFIIKVSPGGINEGVSLNGDDSYEFDFSNDNNDDLLTLKYNRDYLTTKTTNGIISYFTYKVNKTVDKTIRFKLLQHIKNEIRNNDRYEQLLNKSVIGLANNPNFEISDVDLILIPESTSNLGFDLANKIKNKLQNALFIKGAILKNEPENIVIDYELLKQKGYKQDTIIDVEKMVKKATIDNVFYIKKIHPRFRKYITNFLKIDVNNKMILNKIVNGNILIVDDIISEGTTFRDVSNILEKYGPNEIILFSLIG